jgi:hypothetical protein
MPPAYVCNFVTLPSLIFASSSDQTGALPGLTCTRVDEPLPGTGLTNWLSWAKITRLIESLPLP